MPNGKFPIKAAQRLGFDESQIKNSLIVTELGNPYSASAMLGLVSVLEKAKSGEKILMTSYGSGSGSDAVLLTVTDQIKKHRWGGLDDLFNSRRQINQIEYLTEELYVA